MKFEEESSWCYAPMQNPEEENPRVSSGREGEGSRRRDLAGPSPGYRRTRQSPAALDAGLSHVTAARRVFFDSPQSKTTNRPSDRFRLPDDAERLQSVDPLPLPSTAASLDLSGSRVIAFARSRRCRSCCRRRLVRSLAITHVPQRRHTGRSFGPYRRTAPLLIRPARGFASRLILLRSSWTTASIP